MASDDPQADTKVRLVRSEVWLSHAEFEQMVGPRIQGQGLSHPQFEQLLAKVARPEGVVLSENRKRPERVFSAITAWLIPRSEQDRYREEFRAELWHLPPRERLGHALSLVYGAFRIRLLAISKTRRQRPR
jgi:hypothetical protein